MKSLRSIFGAALTVGSLLWPAINALPAVCEDTPASVAIQQPSPVCSDGATIENLWLVDQLNVTYTSNELVRPGNATWRITNTLTNTTEQLHCPLRANYICEMNGTPEDDSLHIWLQINLDVARFTINQSLLCGNDAAPRSAHAIGTAELYLICDGDVIREDTGMSCRDEDDGGGFANGSITLAPMPSTATDP